MVSSQGRSRSRIGKDRIVHLCKAFPTLDLCLCKGDAARDLCIATQSLTYARVAFVIQQSLVDPQPYVCVMFLSAL